MNKILLYFLLLPSMLCISESFAQAPTPPAPMKDRLFFGGNLGASFTNAGSFVDISPIIGCRVNEKVSVGGGPIYQYISYSSAFSGSNFGGRIFTRYNLFENIFAQVEYELVNRKLPLFDNAGLFTGTERRFVGVFLVGGGINQSLGGSASIQIMAMYNLNQTPYSKYSPGDPLYLSMGFGFGF